MSSRYERKTISDQSIMLDAIWLLFGVCYSSDMALEGNWWILSGTCAFLVYKAIARAGFSLVAGTSGAAQNPATLLLLRQFSLVLQRYLAPILLH